MNSTQFTPHKRYSSWQDVMREFIPRIRSTSPRTPEGAAIKRELVEAARTLGMDPAGLAFQERRAFLFVAAVLMNNPDGDRFIWEHCGVRVGTLAR